jgi:hypothetical protein
MSLMSGSVTCIACSMAMVASCSAMIWSLTSRRPDDHFCLRLRTSSTHARLVWLPSQARMKSLRGIFATRVDRSRMRRSWSLIWPSTSRSLRTSVSVSGSGSLRVMNCSAISSRSFSTGLALGPFLAKDFWNFT